ncbi:MAG: hypothetical protein IIT42_00145 [Clostridia bacterium]|nr:hypothetical protein [Clostridia bacterium]
MQYEVSAERGVVGGTKELICDLKSASRCYMVAMFTGGVRFCTPPF